MLHNVRFHENMPIQYTEIFKVVKKNDFFFAQNINCGYTLESPRRGGSNEYPQSMFWGKNNKICIPLQAPVFLYKSGVKWGIHFTDMFS